MSVRFARPYAQALTKSALAADGADREDTLVPVRDDLRTLVAAMEEVPALGQMAVNPAIPQEKKEQIVTQVLSQLGTGELAGRFVRLLLSRFRLQHLPTILDAYEAQVNRRLGISIAEVRSAAPLADVEQERLRQTFERITGQQVELEVTVEPDLLAGFTAQVGSTLYDASLEGQLDRLAHKLAHAS